jgi:hypothetical protein
VESPPAATSSTGASKTMPRDASLYGLGSRLAWIRYRREKRKLATGKGLMWSGILGQLAFGGGAVGVFLTPRRSDTLSRFGWSMVGLAGIAHILMWVGIAMTSSADPAKAGVLLFTTEPVTGVRLVPTPSGVTLTGGF